MRCLSPRGSETQPVLCLDLNFTGTVIYNYFSCILITAFEFHLNNETEASTAAKNGTAVKLQNELSR